MSDSDNRIELEVKNCIVTGEPATFFTGHLIARTDRPLTDEEKQLRRDNPFSVPGRDVWIVVGAGFRDSHVCQEFQRTRQDNGPCYGEWKFEYGLAHNLMGVLRLQIIEPVSRAESQQLAWRKGPALGGEDLKGLEYPIAIIADNRCFSGQLDGDRVFTGRDGEGFVFTRMIQAWLPLSELLGTLPRSEA